MKQPTPPQIVHRRNFIRHSIGIARRERERPASPQAFDFLARPAGQIWAL